MNVKQANEVLRQIGGRTVLAISGGRRRLVGGVLVLPVSNGYTVEVVLEGNDTYTVRRIFTRAGKRWVKGEATDVYCEEVSEVAYAASCFRNVSMA